MPLLNDNLRLWEIGFRWAGYDPDSFYSRYYLPLTVRDNFRILMDAILNGHLDCETLELGKWRPEFDFPPEYFIRHHIDFVYACIEGRRFDRKLLNWATIDRWAIQQWCERQGAPLPEFWFPPGWKVEYEWSNDDDESEASAGTLPIVEAVEEKKLRIDNRHRIEMACKQVASYIWTQEPTLTIKELAWREEIQKLAGGSEYEPETVESWIGAVDPRDPAIKRGRKRKNNSAPAVAEK